MSGDACRVWWLYGPPTVGKSTIAWELYAHLLAGQPRAYFDVDQVGMCFPELPDDPGRYVLKARAAGALVRCLADAGAGTIVVSGVLDEASLRGIVAEVEGLPVTLCRLRADLLELSRRLETRYGPDDVARAMTEARDWDRRASTHPVVDTGVGTPLDGAGKVLEALMTAEPEAAPASAANRTAAASSSVAPGVAVLICGPTGVGKSTVGFALFIHLQVGGPTAFLDLQQVGFLADVPSAQAAGHRARAAWVGALWQQYRAVGARVLVLNGQVGQQADVAAYQEALGDTPLLVCRLWAGPERLLERLTARARGGGPQLAGDELLGRSADELEIELERSLAQQADLDQGLLADVDLDTDGLGPEMAAERLAALLEERLTIAQSGTAAQPGSENDSAPSTHLL